MLEREIELLRLENAALRKQAANLRSILDTTEGALRIHQATHRRVQAENERLRREVSIAHVHAAGPVSQ